MAVQVTEEGRTGHMVLAGLGAPTGLVVEAVEAAATAPADGAAVRGAWLILIGVPLSHLAVSGNGCGGAAGGGTGR